MNWFKGNIEEAIVLSKSKGAIFVVYIEGEDELSKKLSGFIDNLNIREKLESDNFVAIKLKSQSKEYTQFVQIYQLVPVPSIFFIGKNGVPIEIGTSAIKSCEELEEKLDNVLNKFRETTPASVPNVNTSAVVAPSTSTSTTSVPVAEVKEPEPKSEETVKTSAKPETHEVVCEGGVCYKKPIEKSEETEEKVASAEKNPPEQPVTPVDSEEKVKRALQLIEQKRKEKADEEARLEKEREIRRRKEGQELLNLKKWQEDQEMKEIMENRMKEKREAKAAKDRVLAQIAQDKAERAAKFSQIPVEPKVESANTSAAKTPTNSSVPSDQARIQFRKPDGSNETHTFNSSTLFSDLHLFVKNTVLINDNIRDFKLAITFPRREFSTEDNSKTLLELGLTPSSVLLIIPTKKSFTAGPSNLLPTQSTGITTMLTSLVMGLFTPVFALFNYIKNLISGNRDEHRQETPNEAGKRKRNEETLSANDAAKKRNLRFFAGDPGQGPSNSNSQPTRNRRPNNSNVHRLHDNSDSDTENNTYNGNSTQQM